MSSQGRKYDFHSKNDFMCFILELSLHPDIQIDAVYWDNSFSLEMLYAVGITADRPVFPSPVTATGYSRDKRMFVCKNKQVAQRHFNRISKWIAEYQHERSEMAKRTTEELAKDLTEIAGELHGNGDNRAGVAVLYSSQRLRELNAEVARLKAATTWRPIKTAPKDGSYILIYDTYGHIIPFVASWERNYDGEWCWMSHDLNNLEMEPTHWMPLPPAPEAAK